VRFNTFFLLCDCAQISLNLIPLPVIPIQIQLPVGRSQFNSNSSSWIL